MSLFGDTVRGLAKAAASRALSDFLGDGGGGGDITLSCRGASLVIPITPASFECAVSNQNGKISIENAGEYNMMGKTGLKSVSLSSFFPAHDYNFAAAGSSTDPYSYVETLEEWRTGGYPLSLSITGTPIAFPCLVESFKYGEQDGTGDVYYTLELKEYREIVKTTDAADEKTGLKQRPKRSWLERTAATAGKRMLAGQSPMSAITGAMASSGLTKQQAGYLDVYKAIAKKGGVKAGDLIAVGKNYISINGKHL
ncbi:MAG: hypothetical protein MR665_07840 [Selenomonas bovis]|nr:hypothetical protein [Selenomonas bovis]